MKLNEYLESNTNIVMPELMISRNELSTIGKLFFASLLTTIATGQKSPFKISGEPKKIEALTKAVQSTKKFQDEIKRPGATVDSVIQQLMQKNIDIKEFENIFKMRWPL